MKTITLKGIIYEDFINYKYPCMTLMFPHCSFKCGKDVCQNLSLADEADVVVNIETLVSRYKQNHITNAIVFQGLEPMDSFDEMIPFIEAVRNNHIDDDIVIYTGYDSGEIKDKIDILSKYKNIVVKYGRYREGDALHYDEVLCVNLPSDNQYAERIS